MLAKSVSSTVTIWRTWAFLSSMASSMSACSSGPSPAFWRRRYRSRSSPSAMSMVLPEVTIAPTMPIGTTALTLGTDFSAARILAKSSIALEVGALEVEAADHLQLVLGLLAE